MTVSHTFQILESSNSALVKAGHDVNFADAGLKGFFAEEQAGLCIHDQIFTYIRSIKPIRSPQNHCYVARNDFAYMLLSLIEVIARDLFPQAKRVIFTDAKVFQAIA